MVTGAAGQLGHHLAAALRKEDAVCLTRADLDIASAAAVAAAIAEHRPDIVINAAAYTQVDAAEADEATAHVINADGPAHLAAALAEHGGRLIQVSTDYVFDGSATQPYEPDDQTGPQTAYGRTKLAGEVAALATLPRRCTVVRTAWVYGGPGPNFVDTMLRLEAERDFVDVVSDQIGSPTWVADLAGALVELGATPVADPVLHYTNSGSGSWFDLARETFRLAGADPDRVRPTTADSFPRPAPRPAWSVLSPRRWLAAGLPKARPWQEALADLMATRRAAARPKTG
ncbi:MAG: dTDP-4-dehydrorhamnose reductase [Pseudonocardiales bacterium]|nr:dTDP-4-dehydrorhamnose reductase [Pseudonocardiales bacterium]